MFATGPRAVGFTIVWPEGVIFRSMMTYHVLASVHPRACGELYQLEGWGYETDGSSPRVRGTHSPQVIFSVISRFIPARAGNSVLSQTDGSLSTVHPRACGELAA